MSSAMSMIWHSTVRCAVPTLKPSARRRWMTGRSSAYALAPRPGRAAADRVLTTAASVPAVRFMPGRGLGAGDGELGRVAIADQAEAVLQPRHDAQGLRIALEAAVGQHALVQHLLARVAEGWVPEVVQQAGAGHDNGH